MSPGEILRWLWEMNRFSILYTGWLIETWYLLGLIAR
jgi:hypothetical protein